jgi:hypothetical protein
MIAIFGAATLVCAFLLFWVEPFFARLVLPLLGGAPAVWNTCLMFFQTLLLLGYVYAHATSRWLSPRRQVVVHLSLLAVCFFTLPISLPHGWTPPPSGNVIGWLVLALSASVGLPFLVLSATAPILQRWVASFDIPVENPYILYAASNAGSFLGLLAFPLLLEPNLRLTDQGRLWSVVFLAAFALMGLCGMIVWTRSSAGTEGVYEEVAPPVPWRDRLTWMALAFVPSSLLLSVTTYLSTDIAATPLLWVIPLSLYLLTFVIVFAQKGTKLSVPAATAHSIMITTLAIMLLRQRTLGFRVGYAFHLLLFTVTALVLHGELAASRPVPRKLTEYYLWISLGGALGGAFTALIVPLIFRSTRDYTLMLAVGCLLRVVFRRTRSRFQVPLAVIPALLLAIAAFPRAQPGLLYTDRSFFGIYRVTLNKGPAHTLYHGSTIHGAQLLDSPLAPVTYYHVNGPVGQVFHLLQQSDTTRNVGAVGLGTASILCYSRPHEHWTFFEIDWHVWRIARTSGLFSFLKNCNVKPQVVLGDARLTIAKEPTAKYSLLVLDAFSSDAIPVHLMTREAFKVYKRVLNEHGLLLVHISNRRLDLEPVVGALAKDAGMTSLIRNHEPGTEVEQKTYEYGSDWVVLAKHPEDLNALQTDTRWRKLYAAPPNRIWTDDYSNLLSVIKW